MNTHHTPFFRRARFYAPIGVFLTLAFLFLAWAPAVQAQRPWYMPSELPDEDATIVQRAETGDVEAQVSLANTAFAELRDRLIDPKLGGADVAYARANKWSGKAAVAGRPEGQFILGNLHYFGVAGLHPPNQVEGLKWLNKAADQGYARAQMKLGEIRLGSARKEDALEGLAWLKKAAAQDFAEAYSALFQVYAQGVPNAVQADKREAFAWLRKAADAGIPNAQNALGTYYYNGVPGILAQNKREGINWLRKAAEDGHPHAQYQLAAGYHAGEPGILQQDEHESRRWLKKAADAGHPEARLHMGLIYFNIWKKTDTLSNWRAEGELGVSFRYLPATQARMYLSEAAEAGNVHAKDALRQLGQGFPDR